MRKQKSAAVFGVLALALVALPQDIRFDDLASMPDTDIKFWTTSVINRAIVRYEFNDPTDLGHDSSPNGYDLTPVNTPTATGGATEYAADFENGSTQYADGNDILDSGNGISFAFAGWARTESAPAINTLLSKVAGTQGDWLAYIGGGALSCRLVDAVGNKQDSTGATISIGDRVFFHCRYNATTNQIEAGLNGSWTGSPTSTADDGGDTAGSFNVGAYSDGSGPFDGVIGSIPFYRSTSGGNILTDAMTTSLYNSGKGKTCSALTAAEKVNLDSCWDMDEDGGPYADSIGSSTLIGKNTPTQAAALVEQPESGMSAWLVAANNQRFFSSSTSLDIAGSVSLSAWVNPTAVSGAQTLVDKVTGGGWLLYLNGATPTVVFYDAGGAVATATSGNLTAKTWHHLCATLDDGAAATLYTDGTAGTPQVPTDTIDAATGDYSVGGTAAAADFFGGALDSHLLWDFNIAATGCGEVYNAGAGRFFAAMMDFLYLPDEVPHFAFMLEPRIRRLD